MPLDQAGGGPMNMQNTTYSADKRLYVHIYKCDVRINGPFHATWLRKAKASFDSL